MRRCCAQSACKMVTLCGRYLIAKAGADPTIKNHFGLTCYEGLGFKSGPN